MARILVASLPFAGHVGALTAVTAELTRRGHGVIAYTGAKYGQRFVAAGATRLPWTRPTSSTPTSTCGPAGRPGARRVRHAVRQVLDRPQLRRRAGELATQLTAAGGANAAATLTETLLDRPSPTRH